MYVCIYVCILQSIFFSNDLKFISSIKTLPKSISCNEHIRVVLPPTHDLFAIATAEWQRRERAAKLTLIRVTQTELNRSSRTMRLIVRCDCRRPVYKVRLARVCTETIYNSFKAFLACWFNQIVGMHLIAIYLYNVCVTCVVFLELFVSCTSYAIAIFLLSGLCSVCFMF